LKTQGLFEKPKKPDLDLEYEFGGGGDLNNPVEKSENLPPAQKPPPLNFEILKNLPNKDGKGLPGSEKKCPRNAIEGLPLNAKP
jgi:hypothetical protein